MVKAIWVAILTVFSLLVAFGAGALMLVCGTTAAAAVATGGAAFIATLTLLLLILNTLWTP